MMGCREAVVYWYGFVARELAEKVGIKPSGLWAEVGERVVLGMSVWLGRVDLELVDRNVEFPAGRHAIKQIYPINELTWLGNGTQAALATAQARNDTVSWQAGFTQSGEATAETWATLKKALAFQVNTDDRYFLGSLVCYGGIVSSQEEAQALAEELLGGSMVKMVELAWGGWMFTRPETPNTLALFYPDEKVERLASHFFNDTLPTLGRARAKVLHQFHTIYEHILYPTLSKAEKALTEKLNEKRTLPDDLVAAEKALAEITERYNAFRANWGQFERLKRAVEVNWDNFLLSMEREGIPAGVFHPWQTNLHTITKQLQTDEGFFLTTIQEADRTVSAYQAQVSTLQQSVNKRNETGESPSVTIQDLHRMEAQLVAGQHKILSEVSDVERAILQRLDAQYRAIATNFLDKLDKQQLELIDLVLAASERQELAQWDAEKLISLVQESAMQIKRVRQNTPSGEEWEAMSAFLQQSIGWRQKVKSVIPIVPLVLSLESEVSVDIRQPLRRMWERITKRLNR